MNKKKTVSRREFLASTASALAIPYVLTSTVFGQVKPDPKTKKRIVFIAGPDSHRYGEHEHVAYLPGQSDHDGQAIGECAPCGLHLYLDRGGFGPDLQ